MTMMINVDAVAVVSEEDRGAATTEAGSGGGCAPRMRSTHHCETKPIKSSAESPTSSVTGPGTTQHKFVHTRSDGQNASAADRWQRRTAVGQVQRLREQRDGEHDEYVEDGRAEAAGDGHLGAGGAARHALRVVRLLLVPPPRQHVRRKAIRHLPAQQPPFRARGEIGQTAKRRGHDRTRRI